MDEQRKVAQPRGVDLGVEPTPFCMAGAIGLHRSAAEIGDRQTIQSDIVARFGQFERQRSALDLRLAYPRDPNRVSVKSKRKIDIAEKISARADIGERIDVERVRLQVHEHAPAFGADGPGQRQSSRESRSLQCEIQIARDETCGRQIHVADRRNRSIGQDFANGGKARVQIGASERQPVAQALRIADLHVDPTFETGSGSNFDGAGRENMAAARRAGLQFQRERRAWFSRDGKRRIGDRVPAEYDRRRVKVEGKGDGRSALGLKPRKSGAQGAISLCRRG